MSSKELYKRFVELCKKWPRDEEKFGRDYGEFFRRQLNDYFPNGELSQISKPGDVDKVLSSLERIASNHYFNENPLKRSSASGNELWACRIAVSTDGLRKIHEEEETSLVSRLRKNLSIKFSATSTKSSQAVGEIQNK